MGEPLFTLVRESTIGATENLNYTPGASEDDYHDDIRLVDPDGRPCAVPVSQSYDDLDQRLDYIDGSTGLVRRLQRHHITLDVDYIGSDVWRKLQRWMMDRARVYFTPGFGRHTEIAWRPVPNTSGSFHDLTGRHTLTVTGDPARNLYWDDLAGGGVMRAATYGDQRIIMTPAGAGQIFEGANANLADPGYPTASDLGWVIGYGASYLTVSHVPDGFGHADCPDAMHIVRSAWDSTTYLYREISGTAGTGTINAAIWIRGTLTGDARLELYDVASLAVIKTVHLAASYPDWARVDLQYVGDLSGQYKLRIMLYSGSGGDEMADFFVGPTVFVEDIEALQYSQPYPHWQSPGDTRLRDFLATSANITPPRAGTYFVAIYVPDWYEPLPSAMHCLFGYASSVQHRLYIEALSANTDLRIVFYQSDSAYTISDSINDLIMPGDINTLAVTYEVGNVKMYLNGRLIKQSSSGIVSAADDVLKIGNNNIGRGAWPMVLAHFRADRELWDSDRVANEHETLASPAAREPIIAARGRVYRITEIPSSPLLAAGRSYMRGRLSLEQVDYDESLADITSSEE